MKQKMLAKLKSRSGESIGETLVALLVSALALVMLAGAISSAHSLITRGNEKMAEYYEKDNALAERRGSTAAEITIEETTPAGDGEASTRLSQALGVAYGVNDAFSGHPVIAYEAKAGS